MFASRSSIGGDTILVNFNACEFVLNHCSVGCSVSAKQRDTSSTRCRRGTMRLEILQEMGEEKFKIFFSGAKWQTISFGDGF